MKTVMGVVDYGAGNLTSVQTALRYLGTDFFVSSSPGELEKADKLIFPGVGEAGWAMRTLKARGLDIFLKEHTQAGRPLLGICLGCQILLEYSEENQTPCLEIVPGQARRFPRRKGLKVPQMGWNSVAMSLLGDQVGGKDKAGLPVYGPEPRDTGAEKVKRPHPIFQSIPNGTSFYFVHSYYPDPPRKYQLGWTEYGTVFASIYAVDKIIATQFHPEKSGRYGLRLLENFITMQ